MTTPSLTVVPTDATPAPWPPATFTVTPIVDGDHDITTHTVQIALTDVAWRQLVGDIARAIYDRRTHAGIYALILAAGRPVNDQDRADALTKLVARLNGRVAPGSNYTLPPMWDLAPESAMAFGSELAEAAEDPAVCRCGNVIAKPSELTTTCDQCVTRLGGDGR